MDNQFIPKLSMMVEKYSLADNFQAELESGAVKISCNKGNYRFFYDFNRKMSEDKFINLPLYHWQSKRRYIELRNILQNNFIGQPVAMRIQHMVSPNEFINSLKDIIIFESNLVEFVTNQKIEQVFSDFYGDTYVNCIMSTTGNIKISMELGLLPEGSEPVLLHEIVGKKGIASDVVVDTQTQQYPIYVFKGKEIQTYTDIDNELFGLDNTQIDCIRFIMWVLEDTRRKDALYANYIYMQKVYNAALKANDTVNYTYVED